MAADTTVCRKIIDSNPLVNEQECLRRAIAYREIAGMHSDPEDPPSVMLSDMAACMKLTTDYPRVSEPDCMNRMISYRRVARLDEQRRITAEANTTVALKRAGQGY
jgi:hypothetical protein